MSEALMCWVSRGPMDRFNSVEEWGNGTGLDLLGPIWVNVPLAWQGTLLELQRGVECNLNLPLSLKATKS